MNALTDVGRTRSSSDRANQMVLLFRVSKLISPDQNNYAERKISIISIKINDIYFFFFLQSLNISFDFNCKNISFLLLYHKINRSLDFLYLKLYHFLII